MRFIEVRKKTHTVILWAGIFFACLVISALVTGVLVIPPWKSSEMRIIYRSEDPENYWSNLKFFFIVVFTYLFLSKMKVPFIENPIKNIQHWYEHQYRIQDPQNVSLKYALACIVPPIAAVTLVVSLAIFFSRPS